MAMNRFTYVKRGYDPEEADVYIDTIERELRSYREKDSAIKNAILNAQIAADGIIMNAKNEAMMIRENALIHVSEIKSSIAKQKYMLNEFSKEYTQMVDKYLHWVKTEDLNAVMKKIDDLEKFISSFTNNSAPANAQTQQAAPAKQTQEASSAISAEEKNALMG